MCTNPPYRPYMKQYEFGALKQKDKDAINSTKLLVQAANGGKPVDEIDPKIVPVDNGLVDGDVILTTQQAGILIDNLKKKTGNKAEGSFRRKRSSLFFELNKNFAQKWDISNPIPYTIAEDFNAKEIESVEKGIKMITDAARCIKFKHFELSKDASKNPYHFMYFAKNENTTACGISDIGRVSDRPNALWLNFEGTGCLPKDV
ncbi:hypothetical protein WR25_16658 isoform C [Diploscapter pachys]|uniref:Peptidase M12A domain-containing protein n=1 Tax=Diploscapter pachys TaxID=2018661 RepID=A0A2A2KDA6_9BILA|nr:hypothetical protein WR25_16658 isoform B [Diploscapter pachys]PAV71955.1 hypothetical protein WR25_16658 isoform C [Diploscapter pachys]